VGSLAEPLVIWAFCMPESAIRACFRLRAGLGLKVCILEVNFERFFFKKKTHSWGISGGISGGGISGVIVKIVKKKTCKPFWGNIGCGC